MEVINALEREMKEMIPQVPSSCGLISYNIFSKAFNYILKNIFGAIIF